MLRRFWPLVVMVVLAGGGASARADGPALVPWGVAATHLLEHSEPVYPSFALAAGIEGTVVVETYIQQDGRGNPGRPLSGPPSLYQAAAAAIRGYRFSPFERDGKPEWPKVNIEVRFKLPAGVAPRHYPLPSMDAAKFWTPAPGQTQSVEFASLPTPLKRWVHASLRQSIGDESCDAECRFYADQAYGQLLATRILGSDPARRIYLIEARGERVCGAHDCAMYLVEQGPEGMVPIAKSGGNQYVLFKRHGALFPDVLIMGHLGIGAFTYEGYGMVGTQWGALYAGVHEHSATAWQP